MNTTHTHPVTADQSKTTRHPTVVAPGVREQASQQSDPEHTPQRAADTSTPAPRWPTWARVLMVLPLMALPYAVAVPLNLLLNAVVPQTDVALVLVIISTQVTFGLTAVAVLAIYLRLVEHRTLSFAGLVFTRWTIPALLVGLATSAAIQAICAVAVPADALRAPDGMEAGAAVPVVLVVLLAVTQAFFLQGLPEELLFRGYLIKTLAHRPWIAVITSVLFFAVIHLASAGGQQNLAERFIYLLPAFGFAVSAAGLALLTRSVWAAIGIHSGFHLAGMSAAALGVGSGPAMWIATGITHTLVGVVALVLWARRGTTVEYIH